MASNDEPSFAQLVMRAVARQKPDPSFVATAAASIRKLGIQKKKVLTVHAIGGQPHVEGNDDLWILLADALKLQTLDVLGVGPDGRDRPARADRGRVRVTSSGLAKGAEDLLVARKRQPCWTKNEPNAWICLDLGRNRRLSPTHYTLCSGASEAGFDLLSWAFEGYDAARDEWVDLHTEPPPPLTSPWGVQTIKVDARGRRWRYLRAVSYTHLTLPTKRIV